ncbi:hypothetical protein DENSPDRAFT_880924 [Dentipellis sp. KUC8613]|nr:hypothetical protein DENSPDRAFT_880924 [Dentipellis sp. KUC8613]
MQICLIPPPPCHTILFTLSLPSIPQELPFPPYWDAQLDRISAEELDAPHSAYALDKSAWIAVVLQEVTFNMLTMTVSARFLDDSVEEWPLMGRECLDALNRVLQDVREAADIGERERQRLMAARVPVPAPTPTKVSKHKKQRSLAVISYIVSLVSSPRSPSPPPPVSAPAFPVKTFQEPDASSCASNEQSRGLRFRARSSLVDAYRRFVITELKTRLPEGGYIAWTANSMLARSMEHMAYLVQQAGGIVPDLNRRPSFYKDDGLTPSPSATLTVPSPFFEEEENDWRSFAESGSTDTDGSSLHTPLDTPVLQRSSRSQCNVPRSPSPGSMSPEDLETYSSLHGQSMRLRQLLVNIQISTKNIAMEEQSMLSVLEIRSKRRAWSNKQFKGGAHMVHVGLSTPLHSSPLARFQPVTGESLLAPPPTQQLSTRTIEYDVSCLFPVSEESEDEDLEAGLLFPASRHDMASEAPQLERPQIRPRTRSIHPLHALELDTSMSPDPPMLYVPPPPPVPAHATLPPPPAYRRDAPPAPAPMRKPVERHSVFDPNYADGASEFTLAMDMPYAPRQHRRRSGQGFHDEWLPGIVEYQC